MRPASPALDHPTLSERYFIADSWARAARGAIRMAMVLRPEFIDPQKFGVTVALNRRFIVDVFVLEKPALAWLGSSEPPTSPCTLVTEDAESTDSIANDAMVSSELQDDRQHRHYPKALTHNRGDTNEKHLSHPDRNPCP